MALAILGNSSTISLEIYRYVFLHANVSYVNLLLPSHSDLSNEQNKPTSSIDDNNEYAQSCLDASMAAVSKDDMNTMSFVEKPLLTRQLMALFILNPS
jgi:hypothetical protein